MNDSVQRAASQPAFLAGDGEMGVLMREHDWSASLLGVPSTWPQSLRSIVDLLLSSRFPMFVAWGPQLGFLYNDAYAEILGAKHPAALGARFHDVWSEIWPDISPLIDTALAGQSTYHEDLALVVNRKGFDEQAWFTFSYSPVRDETGQVSGMYCTAVETTGRVLAERHNSSERERLARLFEQAPGFITSLKGPEHVFEFTNAAYRRLFNERSFIGRTVREVFPELEGQGFYELLDQVYTTGERFVANAIPIRLEPPGAPPEERFLNFIYEPVTDEAGQVTGIFVEGHDVTEAQRAEAQLRENEAQLRRRSEQLQSLAEVATAVARAPTLEATLDELTQAARRIIGAHQGVASLTRGPDWSQAINAVALTATYDRWRDYAVMPDGSGIYAWLCEQNRPVRFTQVELEAHPRWRGFGRHAPDHPPIRGWLAAPLVGRDGRNLGLLQLSDKEDGGEFDEADEAMLVQLAQLASAAVEQSLTEAALRESEARLRAILETARDYAIFTTDAEGRIETWPAGAQEVFGWSAEEAVGQPVDMTYTPEDRAQGVPEKERQEAGETGQALNVRWHLRRDGSRIFIDGLVRPLKSEDDVVTGFLKVGQDVTDRRATEDALRESEERYRTLFDTIEAGFCVIEMIFDEAQRPVDYRFIEANPAFATQTGLVDAVGRTARALVPDLEQHWFDIYGRVALTGEPVRFENGSEPMGRWFEVIAQRVGAPEAHRVALLFSDVTERRRADERLRELNDTLEQRVAERQAELEAAHEQLRQSQKLEAMGQLTGGVAHDFNNLLTPIIASLDMLLRRGVGSERERRLMDGALQSAERAKTLVQRLLAFARKQPLQPGPVDVRRLVGNMAELIASTSGPRIDLRVEMPPDLPPAVADANQLEMALLNLAVNARDAMADAGVLTISAARESVRKRHPAKLRPGHYVRLSVQDTGTGMDQATLARAVEPFFSTKGVGQGTGLGLSMVHGLAEQLGGGMTITSSPGQGTTVELWLPISAVAAEEDGPTPDPTSAPQARGTALLIDDENLVRMSTADMLMDLGYEVVEASSAEEALRQMSEGVHPDLVVTDHLMPGLSGLDLARDLRLRRPELPVLIVSGYAEMDGIAPGFPRLTKPFRAAELAASLEALMPESGRP